jgi:hypothetical protein
MSIVQVPAPAMTSTFGPSNSHSILSSDDPVALGLRESARRMVSIALFSGVINVLMLSGSLYMLQVYDRVIPSRNVATLLGLSLMVLFAYLVQGYFDALRARMLCRVATLFDAGLQRSIHTALATLPLRGVKPMLMQQPLRDLDQIRGFMSGMGPTAFLDMPWIPIFLVVSVPSGNRHDRNDRDSWNHRHDLAYGADVASGSQGRDGLQRAAAGAGGRDPAQCRSHPRARHDRSVRRTLVLRQ